MSASGVQSKRETVSVKLFRREIIHVLTIQSQNDFMTMVEITVSYGAGSCTSKPEEESSAQW